MSNIIEQEVVLFKLTYIPKDKTSYPNRLSRGNKLPSLAISVGKIVSYSPREKFGGGCTFHSLDNGEMNLTVAKNPGEVYRDTVWYIYKDHSKETLRSLKKIAVETLKNDKQKKLDDILITERCLKETIDFLEDYFND